MAQPVIPAVDMSALMLDTVDISMPDVHLLVALRQHCHMLGKAWLPCLA